VIGGVPKRGRTDIENFDAKEQTKRVEPLLGDPKSAILKLSALMIVSMLLLSLYNIVLDPIFIYAFDWGIESAAWATLLSIAVSSAVMLRWMS
jgi:hypothetical protein